MVTDRVQYLICCTVRLSAGGGERLAFVSSMQSGREVHSTVQIYDFDTQRVTDIGAMQFDDIS